MVDAVRRAITPADPDCRADVGAFRHRSQGAGSTDRRRHRTRKQPPRTGAADLSVRGRGPRARDRKRDAAGSGMRFLRGRHAQVDVRATRHRHSLGPAGRVDHHPARHPDLGARGVLLDDRLAGTPGDRRRTTDDAGRLPRLRSHLGAGKRFRSACQPRQGSYRHARSRPVPAAERGTARHETGACSHADGRRAVVRDCLLRGRRHGAGQGCGRSGRSRGDREQDAVPDAVREALSWTADARPRRREDARRRARARSEVSPTAVLRLARSACITRSDSNPCPTR